MQFGISLERKKTDAIAAYCVVLNIWRQNVCKYQNITCLRRIRLSLAIWADEKLQQMFEQNTCTEGHPLVALYVVYGFDL